MFNNCKKGNFVNTIKKIYNLILNKIKESFKTHPDPKFLFWANKERTSYVTRDGVASAKSYEQLLKEEREKIKNGDTILGNVVDYREI